MAGAIRQERVVPTHGFSPRSRDVGELLKNLVDEVTKGMGPKERFEAFLKLRDALDEKLTAHLEVDDE